MRRELASAFVATTSALGLGCGNPGPGPNPPPPDPTVHSVNPPGLEIGGGTETETETETSAGTGTGAGTLSGSLGPLNPRDAQGRTILLAYNDDTCFVYLPFPPLQEGEQRPPGTAPPSQGTPCPPEMSSPAFKACRGGEVSRKGDTCECFIPGNPPYVKPNACP